MGGHDTLFTCRFELFTRGQTAAGLALAEASARPLLPHTSGFVLFSACPRGQSVKGIRYLPDSKPQSTPTSWFTKDTDSPSLREGALGWARR